jgi:hypothetical protein
MDYPVFARRWRDADLVVCQQRRGFLLGAPWPLLSQADIYRLAMRLIEQHGDGAEIAAVLRARIRSIQDEELTREAVLSAVLSAVAELRDSGNRSLH